MKLTQEQQEQFMLLRHAVWSGQLAVVPMQSKRTGDPVPVLCLASKPVLELDGEAVNLVPLAVMTEPKKILSQLQLPEGAGLTVDALRNHADGFALLDYLVHPDTPSSPPTHE